MWALAGWHLEQALDQRALTLVARLNALIGDPRLSFPSFMQESRKLCE